MTEGAIVPLVFMNPGERGVLVEIRGLRHRHHEGADEPHARHLKKHRGAHSHHTDPVHRLEHRLRNMGLVRGAPVQVLKSAVSGPLIITIKDTRLALSRGVAAKIMVRVSEDGEQEAGSPPAPEGEG